jgi:hypothetical protein
MATSLTTTVGESGIPIAELYRMAVERYERLAEFGLSDDPQIEPINGLLGREDDEQASAR